MKVVSGNFCREYRVVFVMAERSKRQIEIVEAMIEDALISAAEFERECEAFAESQKIHEMADVVEELGEWIEERDADRLEKLGVTMEEDGDGRLVFHARGESEPFVVRPRADMTIAAGGVIVHLNPHLPILEEDVYGEVLDRLLIWAGASGASSRKRFGGH